MYFTHYNDDCYIEYVTRVNGPDDKWHDRCVRGTSCIRRHGEATPKENHIDKAKAGMEESLTECKSRELGKLIANYFGIMNILWRYSECFALSCRLSSAVSINLT